MRTCTLCNQIQPEESFYRGGNWCRPCRRRRHAEWQRKNPNARRADHALRTKEPDPTAYGKLHCEHIASYAKRAIDRFERKTGKEAPPELLAIHNLASRLTDEQHAQLVARNVTVHGTMVIPPPDPRDCDYCGKTYTPKAQGQARSRYCSPTCADRVKQLTHPEAHKAKQRRYAARVRRLNLPQYEARLAQREAERQQRRNEADQRRAAVLASQQRWLELAQMAGEMRSTGERWQHIADMLGYGSAGAAHNAIRLRLGIDPKTLHPSARSGTTQARPLQATK